MRIKAAVCIAILCIGFLLFGMFVPISTETEEYLLQDLPEQYMDTKQEWEEMQSAFSLLNGWSRTTDTAYVSTTKTLFGRNCTVVRIPYLCCKITDVGTAGKSSWSIVYGTVCSDKGTELCKRTSSVSLTIRSDDNTVIYTEGQPIDEASNVLQLSTEQVSDMLTIDAVTIDSDKQKDKPCQVTMTCKTTVDGIGELQVTATADYLGNT